MFIHLIEQLISHQPVHRAGARTVLAYWTDAGRGCLSIDCEWDDRRKNIPETDFQNAHHQQGLKLCKVSSSMTQYTSVNLCACSMNISLSHPLSIHPLAHYHPRIRCSATRENGADSNVSRCKCFSSSMCLRPLLIRIAKKRQACLQKSTVPALVCIASMTAAENVLVLLAAIKARR